MPQPAGLHGHGAPSEPRRRPWPQPPRRRTYRRGLGSSGRALQHEMDHLDGCLFVDRLRGIKRDLIVRKIKKLARAGKW